MSNISSWVHVSLWSGRLRRENLTSMGSEGQPRELGSVHLGSGDFRLVRWPVVGRLFRRPSLMLMNEEDSGGGGECSEQLKWVLGHSRMMRTTLDSGPFQVHGEVATGYRHVSLICWYRTQVETTVLDCIDILGFNVNVAEVLSQPLRIVASNDNGHAVSMLMCQPSFWIHETPEDAALDGWPTASQVRVRSVAVQGDRAEVVVDTDPGWPNRVYCVRTRDRWHEAITENGPAVQWDDPWSDPLTPSPGVR
jgi:hypothetical protein